MLDFAAPAAASLSASVIFNPTAGGWRRARLDGYLAALRARGFALDLRETRGPGDARRLARALAGERPMPDLLVAAGGDGTVNEVANGLLQAVDAGHARADLLPPLGLLPLGTANVLAHELGLPFEAEALAERFSRARQAEAVRTIHLGCANGCHFLLMAGVGFDAQVVERVDLNWKRRLGKGAYALASVMTAPGFAWPRYRVTLSQGDRLPPASDEAFVLPSQGERLLAGEAALAARFLGSARRGKPKLGQVVGGEGADREVWRVAQVIAAKSSLYAGRNLLAPEAAPWRADLQVCLFTKAGLPAAAGYGARLFAGRLPHAPHFAIRAARSLRIEGPAGEPVQADGDIVARLPVEIRLRCDALRLMVG